MVSGCVFSSMRERAASLYRVSYIRARPLLGSVEVDPKLKFIVDTRYSTWPHLCRAYI
jgi:hypothetical protein